MNSELQQFLNRQNPEGVSAAQEPFTLLRGGPFSKVVSKYEHLSAPDFSRKQVHFRKMEVHNIYIRSKKRILLKAIYFESFRLIEL